MLATITATFLGYQEPFEYDFEDEETSRQVKGTARKVWCWQPGARKPLLLKFEDRAAGAHAQFANAKLGDEFRATVESSGSGSSAFDSAKFGEFDGLPSFVQSNKARASA
jgi:hypothetical protein